MSTTDRLLVEFCKNYSSIYCYGAGKFGRVTALYLQEKGIEITAFLQTEVDPSLPRVLGYPLLSLDSIAFHPDDGVLLAVSDRYAGEMTARLEVLHCKNVFPISSDFVENILLQRKLTFHKNPPSNQNVLPLLYHRVVDLENDVWNIAVSPEHFEEQMNYLSQKYPIIRYDDDWSKVKEKSLVVTFDDGYADDFYNALPILEKYRVPAIFFITSGNIGTENEFWWDRLENIFRRNGNRIVIDDKPCSNLKEAHASLKTMNRADRESILSTYEQRLSIGPRKDFRSMNEQEIVELSRNPLVTIGAHTVSHPSLPGLSAREIEQEINESFDSLTTLVGKKIQYFSYPLGDYSASVISRLKQKAINKVPTVSAGLAGTGDTYRMPRNVVRDWNPEQFGYFLDLTWNVFAEERL